MNSKIKFLDFTAESKKRKKQLLASFTRVLDSGSFILGNEVREFEHVFAQYLGSKYCIGVANGTEALQISLMALHIGKGDEVITTPLTAAATTIAIIAAGAAPVFADIDEKGLLDISKIEKRITKKTKAILPVHLYGQAADLDTLVAMCKKHNLFLIEDACQAHGSVYLPAGRQGKNKKLGSIGDIGCFSFYPTKNLSTYGDGGAIVTNNAIIATMCRQLRDYGQKEKYNHVVYGINSRLDEIHASMIKTKLQFLNVDNNKRRELAKRYITNLEKIKDITIVTIDMKSNFHLFVIRLKKRDTLKKYLADKNIQSLIHYPTIIPDQPFMKQNIHNNTLPNARAFVKETLSLPCNPYMTYKQVDTICSAIKNFINSPF